MSSIEELVAGLSSKDSQNAYQCLKELQKESEQSNVVYPHFDTFVRMLDSPNSYVRTRAILLISGQAKWDVDCKIDEIIDRYLKHIMDVKPITARQCIQALPMIAAKKPDLVDCICTALQKANPEKYASSMRSLIYNDIVSALKKINERKE